MAKDVVLMVLGAAVIACASFFLGQFAYHNDVCKSLTKIIQSEPYAYHLQDKLYSIFRNYTADRPKSLTRMQEIMKYGFPGLDDIHIFSDFILSFDRRNRVAHWVCEHLTTTSVANKPGVNRQFSEFQSDLEIPSLFRPHNYDYSMSGYDRGHLAAAANHKTQQSHVNETFCLTNIAPQVGAGFNRDAWNNLEIYVRGLTSVYPNVYVCTGPIYQPKRKSSDPGVMFVEYRVIGYSTVAVPTHFFKIIVCESKERQFVMESYLLPNEHISDDVDLKSFRRPPEEIERYAGLRFFDKIKKSQFVAINGHQVIAEGAVLCS